MKAYRVTGTLPLGDGAQKFTQDVVAASTTEAEHKVFSTLGSRHKLNRRQIFIESNTEIKPIKSKDPKVINEFREEIAASPEEE
ncbi:MAG: 50S ribosomal protein L18a [Euryarchaeota archaeon]|nr:50S ribosomal protein L18a [Euryarchaeota archaeon]|tara:strand:- start:3307 stop:3558 length:252 start_codon:yes stop_codon:yes gene_type:complete